MKKNTPYVYCICRVDKKEYIHINEDLKSRGYRKIKSIVPTVKILRGSKNGKNTYLEAPMLFNYGFIRMKSEKAFDRNFLNQLRRDIPGILGWLKSLESMHPKKKKKRIDNAEDWDDFSIVATITKKELDYYRKLSKQNRIYSMEDITSIVIGSFIVLRGYPFEGIDARVDDFNLTTKMVTLTLYPEKGGLTIQKPIDNVLYSIYENYDEDRLECTQGEFDLSRLPDESIYLEDNL